MGLWARATAVVGLLAFAVIASVLYRELLHWRQAADLLVASQEVLQAIGSTRENLAKAESAQRGYLLTRHPQYLTEFDNAVEAMKLSMANLREMVVEQSRDEDWYWHLETLTALRAAMARPKLLNDETSLLAALNAAKELTWRIDDITRTIERNELERLELRQRDHRSHRDNASLVIAALLLGTATLLVPAYLETKRQRRMRRATERRMADLVENLPAAAWEMRTAPDGSRHFVYVAPSAPRERGVSGEALMQDASAALDSIVPEDRHRVVEAMAEAARAANGFDQRYRVRMPDGSIHWIRNRAALTREPDGSILWRGYWRDITREALLEEELRSVNRELEAFAYSVSHDLRAPLSAIGGFSQALTERLDPALDAKSRHYLQRIVASVTKMSELIDGLLAMARLSREEFQMEAVDLSELARETIEDLRRQFPAHAVAASVEPLLAAVGDRRLLRQVLANLIGNAWKFTAKTSAPTVRVGREVDANGTEYFFVRDNGAGFDMSQAERLFGAFQRLHKTSEFPGTGIGLAIVIRIVHRHGGRIWAESAEGQGATFCFTLPTKKDGAVTIARKI